MNYIMLISEISIIFLQYVYTSIDKGEFYLVFLCANMLDDSVQLNLTSFVFRFLCRLFRASAAALKTSGES